MPADPDALLEHARRLATPVDVPALVADGVLRGRGRWYEVVDAARLPAAARCQVRAMRADGAAVLVRFTRRNRPAERLYSELAGGGPPPEAGRVPPWWAGVALWWNSAWRVRHPARRGTAA